MNINAASVLCMLLLLSQGGDAWASTIRMSDAKVFLEMKPGETLAGTIKIENPTEEPAEVRVYAEDWSYLPSGTGEKVFVPAESLERSASGWISFSPLEFTLDPFQSRELNYAVTLPGEGVEGTYHSVLFFETILGDTQDREGANVRVAARLGSLFYIDVEGFSNISGYVDSIEITSPHGNRPAVFDIAASNSGNTDIVFNGNVMILSSSGHVKGRGELNSIYTGPGMSVNSQSEWAGKLEPGTYDVLFTFDMGQGKSLVEERQMIVE